MDLRGKRAVVTGASAGIGRELSLQLADRGVAKAVLIVLFLISLMQCRYNMYSCHIYIYIYLYMSGEKNLRRSI